MKKQAALLALLSLAAAITLGCGNSNTAPTFSNVAFTSNRSATPGTNLFVAKLDGTNVTPIGSSTNTYSPSTSADFKKIAFVSNNNAFVANADGTGQAQLTTSSSTYFVRISPNGKKVIYSDYSTSPASFWIANLDGTGKVNLAPSFVSGGDCWAGGFSADSLQVVLVCYDNSASAYGIYTTKADGTGLKTVIQSGNTYLDTPSFTPGNKKIVFYADGTLPAAARRTAGDSFSPRLRRSIHPRQEGTLNPTWGVTSVNLDGTGATLLVPGSYESIILNSALYYSLYSTTAGREQIFKSNLDGMNPVSVSDGTSADYLGQEQRR